MDFRVRLSCGGIVVDIPTSTVTVSLHLFIYYRVHRSLSFVWVISISTLITYIQVCIPNFVKIWRWIEFQIEIENYLGFQKLVPGSFVGEQGCVIKVSNIILDQCPFCIHTRRRRCENVSLPDDPRICIILVHHKGT